MFVELKSILAQKDKKKLFVGIGNVLKSDDGTGVYISRKIEVRDNISSLTVETSIENYIGKINSINPDILILVDNDKITYSDEQRIKYPIYDLEFETGKIISQVIISRNDWETRHKITPFYKSIQKEGVTL